MPSVWYDPKRRRWVIRLSRNKTRTLGLWSGFKEAHSFIASRITGKFKFFFVISSADVLNIAKAFIHLKQVVPDLTRKIGLLFSFANFAKINDRGRVIGYDRETLEAMKMLKEHGFEIMVDSGAFHVLARKIPVEKFLSYIDDYIRFVNEHLDLIDWFVTADIPCDARPAKEIQEMPNRWKIEQTVKNTIYIIDRCQDPRKLIAVVQGYNVHEYVYCCDLLRQHGIITARTGVGSLCIRKYDGSEVLIVADILDNVKKNLPQWVKLHAFGLNVKFLQHKEIAEKLYSSDSAAWSFSYTRFGRVTLVSQDGDFVELDLNLHKYLYRAVKLLEMVGYDRKEVETLKQLAYHAGLRSERVLRDRILIYKLLILTYLSKLSQLGLL